ncbi:MAG: hypothetical protein WC372_04720 [Candidatus Neomarinimicrobiota bacterium]|jgi:hypothetical protein|nr:hypothetical protein [Candidatus Neomarinimicrobiota bacterium]MDD3965712.1 hypothetical protein [Candidatus Neomarinimicrobiota bacterium]MDX9779570.1 hypothetical protein [bacterium]
MKPKRLLEIIGAFLEKQNIDIIYGTGAFTGGFCIINENPVVVINRRSPLEEQLRICISVVLEQGFDYSGLRNEVRQYIKRFAGA